MTNREFKFMGALQRADSHDRRFDGERLFDDGRELRAIYDSLVAVAHGIDAACEKLDKINVAQGTWPRDGVLTAYRESKDFKGYDVDGNTPVMSVRYEAKYVPVKVWPISMGDGAMLVEYEDGTLASANLCDIRMETGGDRP
jgi:hypothetical protein